MRHDCTRRLSKVSINARVCTKTHTLCPRLVAHTCVLNVQATRALDLHAADHSAQLFLSKFLDLQNKRFSQSQVDDLPALKKSLASALGDTQSYTPSQSACLQVSLALLFQPGSSHLHAQLLSTLSPHLKSSAAQSHITSALDSCQASEQRRWECDSQRQRQGHTVLPLGQAWLALLRAAPESAALRDIAGTMLALLAKQLSSLLSEAPSTCPQQADELQVLSRFSVFHST